LASEFLALEKQKVALYEHAFCGYFPDVLSNDKTKVIECGHTQNAEKMLTYFHQGDINEYIQIPYPDLDSLIIKGYSFTPSSELKRFLDFLDAEKRSDIKTILKNRKT
jgi:hypothetical protein